MLELSFRKPDEIVALICERLRTERLALQLTQTDVAARAGVGANTVSNLESGRNVSLETVIRVAMVLGRSKELEALFLPKLDSLDDVHRYERSAKRQRVKRTTGND